MVVACCPDNGVPACSGPVWRTIETIDTVETTTTTNIVGMMKTWT